MPEKDTGAFLDLGSPKVKAMYEAVGELLGQGMDLNEITVSDITKKAGIGKGTAYEYFKSKEEIIAKALLYHIQREMDVLLRGIAQADSFRCKIYTLLDNIESNYSSRRSWLQYLCFHMQAIVMKQELMGHFVKCGEYHEQVETFVKEFQEQAVREGIIAGDLPVHFMANAVFFQILGYWYYLDNGMGAEEVSPELEKEFIYENIVKIISRPPKEK